MQHITIQQLANININITVKEQAIKIKNYNVIANNLRKGKEIVNNNNSNCANSFNIFLKVYILYLLC